jgi:tetraacyldisaccharide 4'-kinase
MMGWDYRPILSGQRKDPLAMLLRCGCRIASLGYGVAVNLRNRAYDRGSKPIHRCEVPVISVGNLTTGGTGKTPIVCFLAKWLRERELRVAIISRGYGRGDADANDEALELHDRLPDVPHLQDADRIEAARIAVEELESQVLLMDDGFQHRRLHRDLEIVVIDATCPFGYGYLLPRGLLREPIEGLRRADLVILSRVDLVSEQELGAIEKSIRQVSAKIPIVQCRHLPWELREYPDQSVPLESLSGRAVAIVSAIGNPQAFEKTVAACGARVVASQRLADHDAYEPETVNQLRHWIESLGESVEQVICTHKDLVKLRTDRLGGKPLRALLIDLNIVSGQSELENSLRAIVNRSPATTPA